MEPNWCIWLNQLLQDKLHSSIKFAYTYSQFSAKLRIGQKVFQGQPATDRLNARRKAAKQAYEQLVFLTEKNIRELCQLSPRHHFDEVDQMRISLRQLQKRVSHELAATRNHGKSAVVQAYNAVDALEKTLLNLGLHSD